MPVRCLITILLVCSLFISNLAQSSGLPKLRKNESYKSVRAKMIKAGWKPYQSPDADKCSKGDKRCEGRPEMESCAGTGLANCKFLWKRQSKTVAIFTIGEDAVYQNYEFL